MRPLDLISISDLDFNHMITVSVPDSQDQATPEVKLEAVETAPQGGWDPLPERLRPLYHLGLRLLRQRLNPVVVRQAIESQAHYDGFSVDEGFLVAYRVLFASEEMQPGRLFCLTVEEFLAQKQPPREFVLNPWFRAKDLVMLYAQKGGSKTWVSLGIALAIASGGSFLGWSALRPRRVLYVDGELPRETLEERIRTLLSACNLDPQNNLKLITPDLQERGIPSIDGAEGQELIEEHLADSDVLMLDNLSTLCRGGVENEAESWEPVQQWLLSLRRRGHSVLFDHHAGKSGSQRGTSKREDVLDAVITLKRPKAYTMSDGARFEVHFEKARGLHGEATDPFEAWLHAGFDGEPTWTMRRLETAVQQQVLTLAQDGLNVTEIAKEVGRHKSTVSRILKVAREHGVLEQEKR